MDTLPRRDQITADALTLRDRHWNVVVVPSQGGSLRQCEFERIAVLEPTGRLERIGAAALSCCYFPLIPFANRIKDSRFDFAGATVNLPENVSGTRHAIHGHGWQTAWDVTHLSGTACSLAYRREATSDWPWKYEGRQSFEIADDTLRITLSIHNLDSSAMPCGLGFHPFLPARDGARLQFEARQIWNGNLRDFPHELVPVPQDLSFARGALVAERTGTDHCFEGWRRQAVVTFNHSRHAIVVEGCEAARFVVVYIPGTDCLCVEPVTHAANAMNLRDPAMAGLWTIEPAASRRITMSIRLVFGS